MVARNYLETTFKTSSTAFDETIGLDLNEATTVSYTTKQGQRRSTKFNGPEGGKKFTLHEVQEFFDKCQSEKCDYEDELRLVRRGLIEHLKTFWKTQVYERNAKRCLAKDQEAEETATDSSSANDSSDGSSHGDNARRKKRRKRKKAEQVKAQEEQKSDTATAPMGLYILPIDGCQVL
mgnify:CR=1 FL=1